MRAPRTHTAVLVELQRRPGLPDFSAVGAGKLVSFDALPRFVCNLAMHCDLMSQIYLDTGESMVPYTSSTSRPALTQIGSRVCTTSSGSRRSSRRATPATQSVRSRNRIPWTNATIPDCLTK